MTKFVFALLAGAALAVPALAEPAQKIRFERDGTSYVATVRQRGAVQLIEGYELNGQGRSFALRVAKGQVTGVMGGYNVAYPVPASSVALQTASKLTRNRPATRRSPRPSHAWRSCSAGGRRW